MQDVVKKKDSLAEEVETLRAENAELREPLNDTQVEVREARSDERKAQVMNWYGRVGESFS